jgi:hypothetical protein
VALALALAFLLAKTNPVMLSEAKDLLFAWPNQAGGSSPMSSFQAAGSP